MSKTETYTVARATRIVEGLLKRYRQADKSTLESEAHYIEILTTLLHALSYPPCPGCRHFRPRANRNGKNHYPFLDCTAGLRPYHLWFGHFPTETITCDKLSPITTASQPEKANHSNKTNPVNF